MFLLCCRSITEQLRWDNAMGLGWFALLSDTLLGGSFKCKHWPLCCSTRWLVITLIKVNHIRFHGHYVSDTMFSCWFVIRAMVFLLSHNVPRIWCSNVHFQVYLPCVMNLARNQWSLCLMLLLSYLSLWEKRILISQMLNLTTNCKNITLLLTLKTSLRTVCFQKSK